MISLTTEHRHTPSATCTASENAVQAIIMLTIHAAIGLSCDEIFFKFKHEIMQSEAIRAI